MQRDDRHNSDSRSGWGVALGISAFIILMTFIVEGIKQSDFVKKITNREIKNSIDTVSSVRDTFDIRAR